MILCFGYRCIHFQVFPKESYVSVVKCIFCYLHVIIDLELWYPKGKELSLISNLDANFVRCKVRKSTNGTCHFLGFSLVSWANKKQNFVALSIIKAKYIVTGSCSAQIL